MRVLIDRWVKDASGIRTRKGRKEVEAEFVRKIGKNLYVKLKDGNIVRRRVPRDIPQEVQ